MSVGYRKGPDHHWMTLLRVTKPHWSRPPAANGPERNSPGWVMTVFSASLFTPFWCPRAPPPPPYPCSHQPCFLPVPLQPTLGAPRPSLVIYTNKYVHPKPRSQWVSNWAADAEVRAGPICPDERCSSCLSSMVETGKMEIFPSLTRAEPPKRQLMSLRSFSHKHLLGSILASLVAS